VDPEEILRFHASLPPGAGLAVDEAFLWLAERAWPGGDGRAAFRTLAREAAEREGFVVVGSLTKAFALPGLRLGYAVARPEEVRKMGDLQPAWSVNGLGQALVPLCLREAEGGYLARTLELLRREKRRIEQAFSRDPVLAGTFRLFSSEANFYLAWELGVGGEERGQTVSEGSRVGRGRSTGPAGEPLFVTLGRRGVLVRDLSSVPGLGRGYFRFAVRTEEENLILIRALKEAGITSISPSGEA
jgi:threonine-phosphate decarboxylase